MKIIDFIVCDDIRQEIGGKVTLVGVYADRLIIHPPDGQEFSWPFQMRLGFFMRLYNDQEGMTADSFELTIQFNSQRVLQTIKGKLAVSPDKKLINIFFVNNRFAIPGEGYLSVTIKFKKDDHTLLEISPDIPFKINPPLEKRMVH